MSGLAKGVDGCAHQTVIANLNQQTDSEQHGRPIAVLGCGVLVSYPPVNRLLMDEVIRTGAVISEYLPDMQPRRAFFPARNRLISGLSDVVLVTAAGERSGALITAGFAADQGKEVCAVPGSFFDSYNKGCHTLIKEGAALIDSVGSFADVLGSILANKRRLMMQNERKTASDSTHLSKKTDSATRDDRDDADMLLDLLHIRPQRADELLLRLAWTPERLFHALTELEIAGLIAVDRGSYHLTANAFDTV